MRVDDATYLGRPSRVSISRIASRPTSDNWPLLSRRGMIGVPTPAHAGARQTHTQSRGTLSVSQCST
jgi:hypothetical protein